MEIRFDGIPLPCAIFHPVRTSAIPGAEYPDFMTDTVKSVG
jgi:hypothetical protein